MNHLLLAYVVLCVTYINVGKRNNVKKLKKLFYVFINRLPD